MTPVFDTVLIIGGGLIGSSIARSAKASGAATTVFISDISQDVCSTIETLGFSDGVSQDASGFAQTADIVILAAPPARIEDAAKAVIPHMKSGAVLTDVASVKSPIVTALTPHLREDITFIPGHPIAGTENSGPEAGFAELFQDRWCILTPNTPDETPDLKALKAFWEALGSQVGIMTPERHDLVLATTSHVPHLIAYTLVGTAVDMETVTRNEVVKFSAGGFRDFTRIAASDPQMWRDVFLQNSDSVLEVVDRFIEDLSALKRAIRWNDGDTLMEHFSKTRDIRRRIIDAGQDSPEPNFGRNETD